MVVAHFLESGQRRVYVGPSRERTLMAGAVALASTGYIAAIDEKAGRGHVGSAGRPGFPQREPALPRRQLESRVREAQGRVILLERAGSQPSCGRRDRL